MSRIIRKICLLLISATLSCSPLLRHENETKCILGNCVEGEGIQIYPDGAKYIGEFKDSKQHGKGSYIWPNGDKYVGQWKHGKHEGEGIYTWSQGDEYSGQWKNDKREGKGTYIWSNGDKYIGEFLNGKFHGEGTRYNHFGSVYEKGHWENGKYMGH